MKRAAIYARVAVKSQGEGHAIRRQVDALRQFGAAHGTEIATDHVWIDEGASGATLARPGLNQLRECAAQGRIETLLVCSPDRLSRNCAQYLLLLEELGRSGVEVVFLADGAAATAPRPVAPAGPMAP
jgi:site-specific DNA recombinase